MTALEQRELKLLALIADRASSAGEKQAAAFALAKVQADLTAAGAARPRWSFLEPATRTETARPAKKPGVVAARWPGRCARCRGAYEAGDPIRKGTPGKAATTWEHEVCP